MKLRALFPLIALAVIASTTVRAEEPAKPSKELTRSVAGPWGNMGNAQYPQFNYMLIQLNMTPDFTLDKETKQKLATIQADYQKAQTKFMEENKDTFAALQKEQMEAYKGKDQEKIQAANKKLMEIYASGPKGDDYLAKTKAALPPEQLKIAEEKMKTQMEEWQKIRERNLAPGTPAPAKNDI